MSVRERNWTNKDGTTSKGWFVDVTYIHPDGQKQRVRTMAPGTSKRQAQEYERQVLASLMNGTYGTHDPDAVPLLSDFADEWLEEYVAVHCKPSTLRTRTSAIRAHIKPKLGKHRLDEIGKRELAKFVSKMQAGGSSAKTINNHLGILSSMLSTAIDWEILETAPDIKWLKTKKPEIDWLEFDEVDRLLEAVEEEWRVMVLTGYKTGMRLGELCALRIPNVDLVRQQIRIVEAATRGIVTTPKGGRSRTVPIGDDLAEDLERHIRRSKLKGDLVFPRSDGSILQRSHVKRVIPRACRVAGLRDTIGWHTLRHTYASHLVILGAPIKVVQDLMGHATLEMTMRYAHLAPDVKHSAVGLLDSREAFSTQTQGTNKAQRKTQQSK
jgi:integrase